MQPQYRPYPSQMYGPPPVWREPYSVAVTVLYLVAAPLPIITAVVFGELLSEAWDALTVGNLNGPGLVVLAAVGFSGLLGISCLSNGMARLVRGKRWAGGAWAALVFATLSLAGLFAMVALMAGQGIPMGGQVVLYFVGTLVAVAAGFVGAFVRK